MQRRTGRLLREIEEWDNAKLRHVSFLVEPLSSLGLRCAREIARRLSPDYKGEEWK